MKNLKAKRLLSLLLALMMALSCLAYTVSAEEETADEPVAEAETAITPDEPKAPPAGEPAIEDMFSAWAYWDIGMACDVYKLGNEGTYSNFRGNFVWLKFLPVCESLNAKFGTKFLPDVSDGEHLVTRGELIAALYEIIAEKLEISEENKSAPIDYFAWHGLINGRKNGNYQLDEACTSEEMIVFSVRVYEYLIYKLGLESKGLFWKVSDENNTVYLLGSIHLSDGSLYPMKKEIIKAFNESEYLVVEAQISEISQEDQLYIQSKVMISDGTTIKDIISPELYELYAAAYEYFGITPELYDCVKPWAATLELQNMLYVINEADAESAAESVAAMASMGVDNYFLFQALLYGKGIIELESVKYQMDMFDSYSTELQVLLLTSVLYQYKTFFEADGSEEEQSDSNAAAEYFEMMLNLWKSGDDVKFLEILYKDVELEDPLEIEYSDKLWKERDIAMTEKIIIFLNEDEGDYFVVVGGGHMVGKDGIVARLIEEGFKVERIK